MKKLTPLFSLSSSFIQNYLHFFISIKFLDFQQRFPNPGRYGPKHGRGGGGGGGGGRTGRAIKGTATTATGVSPNPLFTT